MRFPLRVALITACCVITVSACGGPGSGSDSGIDLGDGGLFGNLGGGDFGSGGGSTATGGGTGTGGGTAATGGGTAATGGGTAATGGGTAATGGGTAATGGGTAGTGGGTSIGNGTFDAGVWADGGTYGIPVNGFPNWNERAVLALTNAVRLSPVPYKQSSVYANRTPSLNIATVLSTTYPARGPLYNQQDLNHSSRQHSIEMATRNYFAHESVDGGMPGTRIKSYYTLSQSWGENIAAGNLDPIATMHQWLCDKPSGGTACCDDGASCDGHRRNIMSAGFKALGVGYGFDATSTYRSYWTQDFGGVANPPAPPLIDGAHILMGSTQTRFIANYSAGAAAQSVWVLINEVPTQLAVDLGSASSGTWFVTTARGSGCRPYYFVAIDASGVAWRYPASGAFMTGGEGSCAQEYVP